MVELSLGKWVFNLTTINYPLSIFTKKCTFALNLICFMNQKSLFIVIEGLDGSGKTSVSEQLAKDLDPTNRGFIVRTNEPNDDMVGGQFIRDILTKKRTDYTPEVLPLAFAANRLDHCDRLIKPWLEGEGRIVISDRYYLSSLVYQSSPTFSFENVMFCNQFALKPDIIFFINVDNKICYERMKHRNQPPELFETNLSAYRDKFFKAIEFLRETRNENIVEIDGNGSISEVANAVREVVLRLMS